jgi:hypothetical protein
MADHLPLGVRRIHLEGLVPEAMPASTTPPAPGAVPMFSDALAGGAAPATLASAAGRIADPPAGPRPGETSLAPFSLSPPAGAQTGSEGLGRTPPGPAVDAKVVMIRTAVPLTVPSPAPSGPADQTPVAARPPDPFAREDLTWEAPALLEPRAAVADRSGLDALFTDLGRPLEGPFLSDWWL